MESREARSDYDEIQYDNDNSPINMIRMTMSSFISMKKLKL